MHLGARCQVLNGSTVANRKRFSRLPTPATNGTPRRTHTSDGASDATAARRERVSASLTRRFRGGNHYPPSSGSGPRLPALNYSPSLLTHPRPDGDSQNSCFSS